MYPCLNGATTMPYTLEDDIAAASAAGFPALELWGDKLTPCLERRGLAGLARLLHDARLRPAAIDLLWLDLNQPDPVAVATADLARLGEIARAVACDTLLFIPSGERVGLTREATLDLVGAMLQPICRAAAGYGLRLAIEPLGLHLLVPGPREALRIVASCGAPNLGLAWDFFHYWKSGVPLADVRAIPPERLFLVHANDVPSGERAAIQDRDRVWPGAGTMPLREHFAVLKELGYAGAVSVEIFNPAYWKEAPEAIAKRAYASLMPHLG